MKDHILSAIDSPRRLEVLYRGNAKAFKQALPDALATRPDSSILQAWNERLFFSDLDDPKTARCQSLDIGWVLALSLIAGTLAKLPDFIFALNDERFYSRNVAGILAGALIAFFCILRPCPKKTVWTLAALGLGALLYLNLLPDNFKSDTLVLACMHTPFFLWSLLGVAYLGGEWKNRPGRMDFIRYNGELLIYSTILLIGGMVLTGLTFALFNLIHLHIEEWYLKNVVVYGSVAAPIVATLIVERIVGDRFKIAPLLAKIFTPLFLLTTAAYLAAMGIQHKSPFTDRDFLIAFNGLLVVVLGLCVFSISERGAKKSPGIVDFMNMGLVSVTLLIDLVALSAILFRLSSYGFTPNRLAVLGGNLLAFCHLAGILYRYVRFARNQGPFESLENWIAGYIPAYTTWSLIVAIAFPAMFRFR